MRVFCIDRSVIPDEQIRYSGMPRYDINAVTDGEGDILYTIDPYRRKLIHREARGPSNGPVPSVRRPVYPYTRKYGISVVLENEPQYRPDGNN